MPKFGLNILLWTSKVDESSWPLFDRFKTWGYDGVELPVFDDDEPAMRAAGRRLDDLGLQRTTLTVCTAAQNPISPDPQVRRAGIDWLKRVIDGSAAAGARVLCGPIHSALGEFGGRGPSANEWKWGRESLIEAADYARQADVTLAVEFLNRFECYFLNCAADCARFVAELNHPNLKMMYDTFHAHIEEKDTTRAIRTCAKHLVHVHVSENDRSTPGSGQVDWDATFRLLAEIGYDGWLTIEAFSMLIPELAAATKIWRRMYESEEQLAVDGLAFMKSKWQQAQSG